MPLPLNLTGTNMSTASTSEAQPEAQPGGILFRLLSELRLRIYEMMFPPDECEVFSDGEYLMQSAEGIFAGDYVAILATSCTI